jgi:hypothetical protein
MMKAKQDLGQKLATHRFATSVGNASITLYAPKKLLDGGYVCPIVSRGIDPVPIAVQVGLDGFQAIFYGIERIVRHLRCLGLYPLDASGADISQQFPLIAPETQLLGTRFNKQLFAQTDLFIDGIAAKGDRRSKDTRKRTQRKK